MKKRPCLYHFYDQEGSVDVIGPYTGQMGKQDGYSLTADMARIRDDGIKKGIVVNSLDAVGQSTSRRKLLAVVIGKNPQHKVLFTGCHHAREWISVEVPFLLAEYLVDEYPTSAPKNDHERRIKYLVDNRQIWIVPMVNPDGHEHTRLKDRAWRGTTRIEPVFHTKTFWAPRLGGGGRTIVVKPGFYSGIDPNRNYNTTDWGQETPTTSRDPADGNIWCGFKAESEPETKAIADLIKKEKFRAGMTYHNYSQLLMYARRTKDNAFVQFVGKGMHQLLNERGNPYTYQQLDVLYATTGNEVDYHLDKVPGRPVYTIELSPEDPGTPYMHSTFPASEIENVFKDNLAAALALICCAGHDAPSKSEKRGQATSGHRQVKMPVIPNCWKVFEKWVP